jgi:hypothetical protein
MTTAHCIVLGLLAVVVAMECVFHAYMRRPVLRLIRGGR